MSESQSKKRKKTDPVVGIDLGNYQITEIIGEGGMGAVYAARHPVLGREVAVKVLSRKLCDDEDFLARFRQEALAANRVGHEVIVEATDFGTLPDGRSYYVMERLQGESLGMLMERRGAIPLAETSELMLPVMDALQAAHDAGVIHRDLKPDNIFLHRGRQGEILPRLLDFGLAKMLELDKTEGGVATQTGLLLGTPLYMPPEQFSGKPETLGPWTDVYALAGVVFHMLTGAPPYDEHGFADLLMQHMMAPIPSICGLRPGLSQALDDAIRLALAKKPEERFQNMLAFREAFSAAVESAPVVGLEDLSDERKAAPSSTAHAISLALRPPSESPAPANVLAASTQLTSPREQISASDIPTVAERITGVGPPAAPAPTVASTPPTTTTAEPEPERAVETETGRNRSGSLHLVILLLLAVAAGGFAYWQLTGDPSPARGELEVKTSTGMRHGPVVRRPTISTQSPAAPGSQRTSMGSRSVTGRSRLGPRDSGGRDRTTPSMRQRQRPTRRSPSAMTAVSVMSAMSAMSVMSPGLASLLKVPPDIGSAVQRLYPRLKGCFAKAAADPALLKASLYIRLVVFPSGKVRSARIRPANLAGTAVGRCLKNKVRAWNLPAHPNPYNYAFGVRFSAR